MNGMTGVLYRTAYWQRILSVFVLVMLTFARGTNASAHQNTCSGSGCAPTLTVADPSIKQTIHPLLLDIASQQPDKIVSVIVQKAEPDHFLEDLVSTLGGHVTADLSMIRSFAAELKASDLLQLSNSGKVRWISPDSPLKQTQCTGCLSSAQLGNTFVKSIHADQAWNLGLQGQDVGVAVVDSGINYKSDFYTELGVNRVVAAVAFHNGTNASIFDAYSHGTHVAGIIGGNGRASHGKYMGVAPKVSLINVKVNDDTNFGEGTASSLVQGLQWILQNKALYNIRVVNISINSTVAESYHTSPIDAAVEILWFNGIVVVTSAGNLGSGAIYPPANDPFVITVGAADDQGTESISDDTVAPFSAYGTSSDGVTKPDLVAPGRNIVSLTGNLGQGLPLMHPDHIVNSNGETYLRISGTSMAAPMVAGAVALLVQHEPSLTPDQIKYRLLTTASKNWPGYQQNLAGAGYLDVLAAVSGNSTNSANTGQPVSNLLTTGEQGVLSPSVSWSSVSWSSVSWSSVSWSSVSWSSVSWSSVSWSSDYWGDLATVVPTATPTLIPTNTPVPPTNTPTQTNTPVPPTSTPTSTPTRTNTPVPPTSTPSKTAVPPTSTPTRTSAPPTSTPLPPTPTVQALTSTTAVNPNGIYKIVSRVNGNVLGAKSTQSTVNGQKIVLQPYSGATYQQWRLVAVSGGYFNLVSLQTKRVLDTYPDASVNGGQLQLWQLGNGTNQQWKIAPSSTAGYMLIVSRSAGQYVDLKPGDNTPITHAQIIGTKSQQWQIVQVATTTQLATLTPTVEVEQSADESSSKQIFLPVIINQ